MPSASSPSRPRPARRAAAPAAARSTRRAASPRSARACPAVGVPAGTGDVTLFDPAGQPRRERDRRDRDDDQRARRPATTRASTIVDHRHASTCAARRDPGRGGARRDAALFHHRGARRHRRGRQAGRAGRRSTSTPARPARRRPAQAVGYVDRAAATLPDEVREQITAQAQGRRRGCRDRSADAARRSARRCCARRFEVLVGFQLTDEQLQVQRDALIAALRRLTRGGSARHSRTRRWRATAHGSARERAVQPCKGSRAAEGATAPESLRQQGPRAATTLWKALAASARRHRRGKPRGIDRGGESSQVPVTEGASGSMRLPARRRVVDPVAECRR